MRELLILAIHPLVTFARLLRPSGVGAVAVEFLLLKFLPPMRHAPRTPLALTGFDPSVLAQIDPPI